MKKNKHRIFYFKNLDTGEEFVELDVYLQAKRAVKSLRKFCKTFEEYVKKGCVYMKTLTVANEKDQEKALKDYSRFWNSYSQRIKRKGYEILGTFFILELQTERAKNRGEEVIHFHTVFVTDKPIYWFGVPDWLKADISFGRYRRLWKWGWTNIVRIEKSLSRYLAKYFCNSKKLNMHGFTYLYDLKKIIGKNKKLFYSRICKEAKNLAYKIFDLPSNVYKKIRDRLSEVLDIEPFIQDDRSGFLVIFKSSFEFIPKMRFRFLGWKEVEFEGV